MAASQPPHVHAQGGHGGRHLGPADHLSRRPRWVPMGRCRPSNRITVAQIGLGVMGQGHVRRLTGDPSVEMLAVCDVDQTRLSPTQATVCAGRRGIRSPAVRLTTITRSCWRATTSTPW